MNFCSRFHVKILSEIVAYADSGSLKHPHIIISSKMFVPHANDLNKFVWFKPHALFPVLKI